MTVDKLYLPNVVVIQDDKRITHKTNQSIDQSNKQ